MTPGVALILGGTGMLGAVSRHLAGEWETLYLASRHPEYLAGRIGAKPLALDWRDHGQAKAAIDGLPPLNLLISWTHREGEWLLPHLTKKMAINSRGLQVLGSAARHAPMRRKPLSQYRDGNRLQTIILGSVQNGAEHRWLSHEEICAGVMEALMSPGQYTIYVGNAGPQFPGRNNP